jgi:hypothetical protein
MADWSGGKQMKECSRSFRALLWIIGILSILAFGCSNEKPDSRAKADSPQGFTFFDLGANSKYSRSVRNRLGRKLGSDSISQQNTIDLSIHDNGFLEKWFPGLADLNRQLNWPVGQRVEHNTTKLMYRQARMKNTPFIYVELFFSEDSMKPLLFRIVAGPDGDSILETIRKKYGPPKEFQWEQKEGRTQYWEDGDAVFIVSSYKTRQDTPEYLFCIYYVDNLKEMLTAEEALREAEDARIRKAGESAF